MENFVYHHLDIDTAVGHTSQRRLNFRQPYSKNQTVFVEGINSRRHTQTRSLGKVCLFEWLVS